MENHSTSALDLANLPCDNVFDESDIVGCIDDKCPKTNRFGKKCYDPDQDPDKFGDQSAGALTLGQSLEALQETQMWMEQELDMEMKVKRKEMEARQAIKKRRSMLEKQLREKEEEEETLLQNETLRERRCHLERLKANHQSFLDSLKNLDDEIAKLNTKTKVSSSSVGFTESKRFENDRESDTDEDSVKEVQYGLGPPQCMPTRSQLAARHGLCTKLPIFTGEPEQWPLFYGAYQASNEACGYTDIENLIRLQDCLKGPALEMVRGQLLLPKSVPRVIQKLRQLYGRPEQLLRSHLEKIRSLAPPKADNLASFIPFGTVIEQLCEHLEAAGMREHLINPLLIQELVDKLPDSDKRGWVRFKRRSKKVTLRTFTDFVSEIVLEACEANVKLEYDSVNGSGLDCPLGKIDSKEGTEVTDNDSDNESSQSADEEWREPCESSNAVGLSAHIRTNSDILFRVLPVKLHNGEKTISTLAFLDEGASVSLVEKKLADRLGVQGNPEELKIEWTAGIDRVEKDSKRTNLWISGDKTDEKVFLKSVHTVEKLKLPVQSLNAGKLFKQYQYLRDLPISSYSGRPEILIGINNIHSFAPIDSKIRNAAEPVAVKCKLGWAVYGPWQASLMNKNGYLGLHRTAVDNNLHRGPSKSSTTMEKSEASGIQQYMYSTKLYDSTHVPGKSGRLPMQVNRRKRKNHTICGRDIAMSEEYVGKSSATGSSGCYGLGYVTTSQESTTDPPGGQLSSDKSTLDQKCVERNKVKQRENNNKHS